MEDSPPEMSTSSTSTSTSNSGEGNSGTKTLSAAEMRERRRQKILANQSSRMSMITGGGFGVKVKNQDDLLTQEGNWIPSGSSSEDPPDEVMSWSKMSRPGETVEEEMLDNGVSIIRRRITRDEEASTPTTKDDIDGKGVTSSSTSTSTTATIKSSINLKTKGAGSPTSPKTVTFAPGTATAPSSSSASSTSSSPRPSPVGFMMTQPDGSTLHPKLSNRACRILVMILGIFLALLNAKYFLVTFCSWEVAVLMINGFPNDEEPSGNLILLIALLGMKEPNLKRFKFILKLGHCFITDFSILMVSSLTCRILFENFMGVATVK